MSLGRLTAKSLVLVAAIGAATVAGAACSSSTGAPAEDAPSSAGQISAAGRDASTLANDSGGESVTSTDDDAGDGGAANRDDASDDDGVTTTPDASADAAPPVNTMPQVIDKGGRVLASPKVVVMTFSTDAEVSAAEGLASTIGASPYWASSLGEYGVGPLVAGAPVHLQRTTPSTLTDSDSQSVIKTALVNNGLGAPDPSTIYALIVPQGTTAYGPQGNPSCGFGGYHSSYTAADGVTQIPYAIIVECSASNDQLGVTMTHELAEAATDPYIPGTPAYQSVGLVDLGLVVSGATKGTEVGDMCEGSGIAGVNIAQETAKVSRIWSNAAARAGTEPCLPARSDLPFFMTLPSSVPDMVTGTKQGGMTVMGNGFHLANGESRTIDLTMIGVATVPSWSVSVGEVAPTSGGDGTLHLTFTMDKTQGHAGDHIALTIKAINDTTGGIPFVITSTRSAEHQSWYGVVSAN